MIIIKAFVDWKSWELFCYRSVIVNDLEIRLKYADEDDVIHDGYYCCLGPFRFWAVTKESKRDVKKAKTKAGE